MVFSYKDAEERIECEIRVVNLLYCSSFCHQSTGPSPCIGENCKHTTVFGCIFYNVLVLNDG